MLTFSSDFNLPPLPPPPSDSPLNCFNCGTASTEVASESTNFIRLYPLSQKDITTHSSNDDSQSDKALLSSTPTLPPGVEVYNPTEDYTPPAYITLLITDLGVLTPSAVSDELIKLWQ